MKNHLMKNSLIKTAVSKRRSGKIIQATPVSCFYVRTNTLNKAVKVKQDPLLFKKLSNRSTT